MSAGALPSVLLRARRPPALLGLIVAAAAIAGATALIYPLKHLAPVVSLGVVYLLAVVLVSMFWGLWFGVATAIASAAAFSFFHLPPVGRFTLADGRNWIGLSTFVVVAVATGMMAELARTRADEADQRRREADLAAQMAQLLLGATRLEDALPLAAEKLATTIGAQWAAIELGDTPGQGERHALALHAGDRRIGELVLPASLAEADLVWLRARVVPSLESILAAALHRSELQSEVVETAALRRSDEMKTAVLRSVSHDLRTPVTAILTAAGALDARSPTPENAIEVRELVVDAATRLSRLIEKLLDLSMLQAGGLAPRTGWYSVEEVVREAIEHTGRREIFAVSVDRDLPLLQGDAAQLERAFANILENAARFSAGKPVSVRARAVGERVRIRVVDQGPGIAVHDQQRVFLPFYRAPDQNGHHGSGLGLAIAKGFIEVNGGRVTVESVPGQGTSIVVEFPIVAHQPEVRPLPEAAPAGR